MSNVLIGIIGFTVVTTLCKVVVELPLVDRRVDTMPIADALVSLMTCRFAIRPPAGWQASLMRISTPTAFLIVGASLCLSACVSTSLPGIPATSGAADPQLQALAKDAIRHQDKEAQLALGIRYEYGRGVPVDWRLASQLYHLAATGNRGGIFGMTNGIANNMEPSRKGLPEAKARYEALRAKIEAAKHR